jgi:hypothetical protein
VAFAAIEKARSIPAGAGDDDVVRDVQVPGVRRLRGDGLDRAERRSQDVDARGYDHRVGTRHEVGVRDLRPQGAIARRGALADEIVVGRVDGERRGRHGSNANGTEK